MQSLRTGQVVEAGKIEVATSSEGNSLRRAS
jgi:hypothetical protein